jgi:thioester reductase-like protein
VIPQQRKRPEDVLMDWTVPGSLGYAQSKFVPEQVLALARRMANIPTAIRRVGQTAGPGREWRPSVMVRNISAVAADDRAYGPCRRAPCGSFRQYYN